MKTFSKLIVLAVLLASMAACGKKDKEEIRPDAPVTAESLLDHYVTIVISGSPSLRIIYFNKVGNEVKGTLDIVTSRRVQTINVVNDSFSFDTDGDGKKVYNFKLSRDGSGKLFLSSYTYVNTDEPAIVLSYAQIDNVSDVQDFKGKSFVASDHADYTMNFLESTWEVKDARQNDDGYAPYYVISPGAWKGKRNNGPDYMGVSVPKWKGDQPVMLVQHNGDNQLEIYKVK